MDDLGPQERAVLDAVTANPFAGQQEIATALGLARSTVAAHIVQLVQKGYILGRGYVLPARKRIMCLGGVAVDRKYVARAPLVPETSNPVESRRSFGGVARNVAENLARLGVATSLSSVVGDDENGRSVLRQLRDVGIDVSQVVVTADKPTAEYVAVLGPDGGLAMGLADMGIFDLYAQAHLERAWPHLASSSWVFADCNLSAEILAGLVTRKDGSRFQLAVDAVSTPKVMRLPANLAGVDLFFLNLDEAQAYLGRSGLSPRAAVEAVLERGAREVVLTMGAAGVIAASRERIVAVPSVPAQPIDVTGAGDAMIAGTLYRVLAGEKLVNAVKIGALLSALTIESDASVHPNLSPRFLSSAMNRIPEQTDQTT